MGWRALPYWKRGIIVIILIIYGAIVAIFFIMVSVAWLVISKLMTNKNKIK